MTVTITIGKGTCICQRCVACGGETWKNPIQAFVMARGSQIPIGAICEKCLRRPPTALIARLGEPPDVLIVERGAAGVPTFPDLERAREVFDLMDNSSLPGSPH